MHTYKQLTTWTIVVLLTGQLNAQIGVGTASPNSSLDVRGALAGMVHSFTTNFAADINHHTLLFKGTTATTLSLPDATTCRGRIYTIKNASTAATIPVLTIQPQAAQTIGGFSNAVLDEAYELMRIISNGSHWVVYDEAVPLRVAGPSTNAWFQGGNSLLSMKSVGTTSAADMAFKTSNIEQMRISSSGFLGLNASPAGRLHLVNENNEFGNDYVFDDYGTTTAGFFMRKSRGTVASPADLASGDLIGQLRFSGRHDNSLNRTLGAGMDAYYLGNGSSFLTDLRFFTSGAEQMRIDPDGNTAIGTTAFSVGSSTVEQLVVDAGTSTTSYNVISGKGSIDNYLQLNIRNASNGSNASSDIVATADNGNESENYVDMGINSSGFSNLTYPNISGINTAYLYATGEDFVIGNGSAGYDLIFFNSGYALTNERMRITAAGNIGIGTGTPTEKLTVAGIVAPQTSSTYSLGTSSLRWKNVWATSGTMQTSDARLKKNIKSLGADIAQVLQLTPVHYTWKAEPSGDTKIGFLAQQVKQIVPEAVFNDEQSGVLGMNYATLVPVLIDVVQQQQESLDSLKKELQSLEEQQ